MVKFSLDRPLVSAALFAAGLWCFVMIHMVNVPLLESRLAFGAWLAAGAFIGAAILHPFRAALLGAMVGVVAQILFIWALVHTTPI
jgi:hypothetical protein